MAIKLFERVDSGRGLFAVETISLIYNALTSLLILLLFPRMDHPGMMLLERLGIVILTFVLIFLYQAFPCRLTAFVRMAVQMSLLAYWYPDTFEFNRLFPNLDYLFAHAEQILFGCQPAVEFSKLCPSIWFSEPFNMGYFFYYPMILVVVVYYFLNRFEWFEKICFVLVTSFFIYYFVYIMLPVAGPQFYFPAIGMDKVNACIFPAIGDYFNTNDYLIPGPGFEHGFFTGSWRTSYRSFSQFTCRNIYYCNDNGMACKQETGLCAGSFLYSSLLRYCIYSGALSDRCHRRFCIGILCLPACYIDV